MVLEEASSSQEPSAFSESLPTSDVDTYSGNAAQLTGGETAYLRVPSGSEQALYVNLNDLPRRWALTTRPHSPQLTTGILKSCQFAATILQRPLRQDEVNALAFHFASSIRTASFGPPIGAAIALGLWYRGRETYRFPGWTPDMKGGKYDPNRFGPFRGTLAKAAWQCARSGAYGTVWVFGMQAFFLSYALTRDAAGRAMDPRLKDFIQALSQKARDNREFVKEASRRPIQNPNQSQSSGDERSVQQQQQQDDRWSGSQTQRGRVGDDMSPTGGSFQDDFVRPESDSGSISMRQARPERSTTTPSESDGHTSMFGSQSSSRASSSAQSSSKQSGSAWDRLRKDAMSGTPGKSTPTPQSQATSRTPAPSSTSSSGGDSFSFSQAEEDRQLAKSEAQKAFDTRIEQEREGRDFDESSGRGKR